MPRRCRWSTASSRCGSAATVRSQKISPPKHSLPPSPSTAPGRPEVVTTSWLCTVAKRRLIDHWRRKNVASKNVIPLAGRGIVFDTPEAGERDAVIQALSALTPEQRSALVLQHVEGYAIVEVSEIIGRSSKATESLLSRARSSFRAAYSEVDHV